MKEPAMKHAANRDLLAGPSYTTKCVAEGLGRVAPDVVTAYEAWEKQAIEDKNVAFSLMESLCDAP